MTSKNLDKIIDLLIQAQEICAYANLEENPDAEQIGNVIMNAISAITPYCETTIK